MFCGHSFTSSSDALISHASSANTIEQLTIQNAVFDEIYATIDTIDTNTYDGTIPSDWTFATRFHALFNGDLYGGNVNFTESIVELVRIKKRTGKDTKFKTIFEKEIQCNEDLSIEYLDYFEPTGEIEYAYVPVISGGEANYIVNKVTSAFNHYFLCEKGRSFPLILDAKYTQEITYESNQVKPLGRKYPITVINGNTGYKSGSMDCTFLELKEFNPEIKTSFDYRNLIYDALTNGKPKILKDMEGNLLMVNISGSISESDRTYNYYENDGFFYITSNFKWTECGDAYDVGDLYDNNFIDTDRDR